MEEKEIQMVIENKTNRELKASVIVEAEYFSKNLVIGEERTFCAADPKIIRYRIILEEEK